MAQAYIVDNLIDMNTADANGTTVTTTILNNGTQGTPQGTWSITGTAANLTIQATGGSTTDRPAQCYLRVGGTQFLANSTHRIFRYNASVATTYASITTAGGNFYATTWAGWVTFNIADPGVSNGKVFDVIRLDNQFGDFIICQYWSQDAPSGGGLACNLHYVNAAGSAVTTGHMAITVGSTHYIVVNFDSLNNTGEIDFYNTSLVLEQSITITNTHSAALANKQIASMRMGNSEAGTGTGNIDFENIMIDWTKAAIITPTAPTNFFIEKSSSGTGTGTTTTVVSSACPVTAGDIVVVAGKFESTTTTATCKDSNSVSLTQWVPGVLAGTGTSGAPHIDLFWYIAPSTGSLTFTMTLAVAKTFRDICVIAMTPPSGFGTPVLDGTATGTAGTSTAADSGAITTTGTLGMAFGFNGDFGSQISPVAVTNSSSNTRPDGYQVASATRFSTLWACQYNAGFTGDATGTLSASNSWTTGVMAIKVPAAGSARGLFRPPTLTLGVGGSFFRDPLASSEAL